LKPINIKPVEPTFSDVLEWFNDNMAIGKIDLTDQRVYENVYHAGKFPGVFQCTSHGAQRFFVAAKPRSIEDIAVLTSIYRPGPLAAKVDDLWLKANAGEEYDWGDKRINSILSKTKGLLIFQEGVMTLAELVAGFPKDKCDEVRRAIMKRSISGGADAKKKVDEMKDQFVAGAVANGYDADVAANLYEKIGWFSGYAFNRSHAVSYAIDSYYCAWLLTHHEEEWLLAYLESMSDDPEDRARAFGEVRGLGYSIEKIDINYSTTEWSSLGGKKFVPSFNTVKGVGDTAVQEIIEMRPYATIEDLLWNDDGSWKHSKLNKKSLDALIKMGAFESMDMVGSGKLFSSYRQMHHVIIENADAIRKTTKRDPMKGRTNFYDLLVETAGMCEWTRAELSKMRVELQGSLDVAEHVPGPILARLNEKEIRPVNELDEGQVDIVWFVVIDVEAKTTKNKRPYLLMHVAGPSGKTTKLRTWGWDGRTPVEPYAVCIAEVKRDSFGCSTTMYKVKQLA
jgi:DNA polymerase III alpha subunit